MHDLLCDYLISEGLLCREQSGFRRGHSTVTATLDVLDDIYWGMDRGSASGLVFLDLRKAFDMVDQEILLTKLGKINISPEGVDWFRAYLCGRQQSTEVNGKVSKLGNINISLYADDTVIWTRGYNIVELQDKLQQDLINITQWLRSNKLSVNAKKCKSMVIHLLVCIENELLECVNNYKYLGIYLD